MTDSERIDELTRLVADLSAKVDLLVRYNVPKVRCADDGPRNPYWLPRRDDGVRILKDVAVTTVHGTNGKVAP